MSIATESVRKVNRSTTVIETDAPVGSLSGIAVAGVIS
jgi:hypothetical protein